MALREVKLCLLGDSGVGKSSIVLRFVRDQYQESLESTIGASFMTKHLLVGDKTFVFQIWDTAGQEKYRALAPMYYRGAAAAIIVYDITKESSFQAVKDWVRELQRMASGNIVIAVAGNKCDLADIREIPTERAKTYADEIGAIFVETSALSSVNIHEVFQQIARKLPADDFRNSLLRGYQLPGTAHRRTFPEQKEKTGCCGGSQRGHSPQPVL